MFHSVNFLPTFLNYLMNVKASAHLGFLLMFPIDKTSSELRCGFEAFINFYYFSGR